MTLMNVVRLIVCASFVTFSCSRSWWQHGSISYHVGIETNTQRKAKKKCAELGAQLATVDSEEIYKFIVSLDEFQRLSTESQHAFYIGLERISTEKYGFAWSDGTLVTDTFSNWDSFDPNNYQNNESCVTMGWIHGLVVPYKWKDVNCGVLARYICEKPMNSPLPSKLERMSGKNAMERTVSTEPKARGGTPTMTRMAKIATPSIKVPSAQMSASTKRKTFKSEITSTTTKESGASGKADPRSDNDGSKSVYGTVLAAIGVSLGMLVGLALAALIWFRHVSDKHEKELKKEAVRSIQKPKKHPRDKFYKIPRQPPSYTSQPGTSLSRQLPMYATHSETVSGSQFSSPYKTRPGTISGEQLPMYPTRPGAASSGQLPRYSSRPGAASGGQLPMYQPRFGTASSGQLPRYSSRPGAVSVGQLPMYQPRFGTASGGQLPIYHIPPGATSGGQLPMYAGHPTANSATASAPMFAPGITIELPGGQLLKLGANVSGITIQTNPNSKKELTTGEATKPSLLLPSPKKEEQRKVSTIPEAPSDHELFEEKSKPSALGSVTTVEELPSDVAVDQEQSGHELHEEHSQMSVSSSIHATEEQQSDLDVHQANSENINTPTAVDRDVFETCSQTMDADDTPSKLFFQPSE